MTEGKPLWLRMLVATALSVVASVIITLLINFAISGGMADAAIGIGIAIAVPLIIVPFATYQVYSLTDRLSAANAQLLASSQQDPLTGILNRRAFFDLAENQMHLGMRHDIRIALLMIDFDRFKSINDEFGHRAGDQVLIEGVKRMESALRDSDLLARYGGEEFIALLSYADNPTDVAERVRQTVSDLSVTTANGNINPTVSVGTVTWQKGETLEQLIERADVALYQAKNSGRDRVIAA